jgi:hypothetical protein
MNRALSYLKSEKGRPALIVLSLGATVESFVYINGYLARRRHLKQLEQRQQQEKPKDEHE